MRTTTPAAPLRPVLADEPSLFMSLERAVEDTFRPLMLAALQQKVEAVAESMQGPPRCPVCGQSMARHDAPMVSAVISIFPCRTMIRCCRHLSFLRRSEGLPRR